MLSKDYLRRKFDMKLVKKKFDDKPSRVDSLKKKFDHEFSDAPVSKTETNFPIKDITGKTTPSMIAKPEARKASPYVFSKREQKGKTTHCLFKTREATDVLESDCVNIYIYADDKSREPDAGTALDSKQVDDKFKEIMQKRKGRLC